MKDTPENDPDTPMVTINTVVEFVNLFYNTYYDNSSIQKFLNHMGVETTTCCYSKDSTMCDFLNSYHTSMLYNRIGFEKDKNLSKGHDFSLWLDCLVTKLGQSVRMKKGDMKFVDFLDAEPHGAIYFHLLGVIHVNMIDLHLLDIVNETLSDPNPNNSYPIIIHYGSSHTKLIIEYVKTYFPQMIID